MSVSDPIADMLTCIRNACQARHRKVDVPGSKVKEEIVKVLVREHYVYGYKRIEDNRQGVLRVYLSYGPNEERVLGGLKRVSRPGWRVYVSRREIPRVMGGLGTAILSTSQGVMTDKEARKAGLGGELLAHVW